MNRKGGEIYPDEILLDASNVPGFDRTRLEGRLENPISGRVLLAVGAVFAVVSAAFVIQAWNLQAANGPAYRTQSMDNVLRPVPIFASRGAILDRNGTPLAWNAPPVDPASGGAKEASSSVSDSASLAGGFAFPAHEMVPRRTYASTTGLAHILGYVRYPSKDKNGFYYRDDFEGVNGVEKYYNDLLTGRNGSRLVETDASGRTVSENTVDEPVPGQTLVLSIDSRVQSELFNEIKGVADSRGFTGGAGVIMDAGTGELVAVTSYPEYSPQIMSDASDTKAVNAELNDPRQPFLDRAVDGLYAPGSTVKPYIAMGALNEGVVTPQTTIDDAGYISIPNPYDPLHPSIFRGWKPGGLGPLDIRHAIAMSSDIYFYEVGGGYQGRAGLGIAGVDRYLGLFGLGEAVPQSFVSGPAGLVSSPAWKEKVFGQPWYLGDTYHTAIGQYGTQVTPIQMVRAVAAIGNGGRMLVPTVLKSGEPYLERVVDLPRADFEVVRQGMRLGVTDGISSALNVPYAAVAAKTGTAQTGPANSKDNSWVTGFWPYDNPKYAFAVVMENGPADNLVGAIAVMRRTMDWMDANTPEYFK